MNWGRQSDWNLHICNIFNESWTDENHQTIWKGNTTYKTFCLSTTEQDKWIAALIVPARDENYFNLWINIVPNIYELHSESSCCQVRLLFGISACFFVGLSFFSQPVCLHCRASAGTNMIKITLGQKTLVAVFLFFEDSGDWGLFLFFYETIVFIVSCSMLSAA